ncbi:Aste57867_8247 [Aphanomyces stellatus]|uniref:Aste57867_8247 protein n=1 Tax=Aphanomyces stellatus TaxID=120398 RepID=A0A485KJR1_9STRA|nr:hypothetical protein As57867_008216 [Aphanomyces stellatus]VFT85134.1 Aste57867_8247 [Aphanomyces stellatus]
MASTPRKSKRPTLSVLAEDEEEESPNKLGSSTQGGATGKKRLQLTIKNVLLRAQAVKIFNDKSSASILPDTKQTPIKLAPIANAPSKPANPQPSAPPPLMLNHATSHSGNIWNNVVRKATLKTQQQCSTVVPEENNNESSTVANPTGAAPAKPSLRALLSSPKLKNYVDKAAQRHGSIKPSSGQSTTMRQWSHIIATAKHQNFSDENEPADDGDGDDDENNDENLAAERRKEAAHPDYGRNLILQESCRAAFTRDAENRSNADLQALKTWFQKTKLKTCTDFESLQAVEVHLRVNTLCIRMKLQSYYANEVVFKQGDEGDALYIVFSGSINTSIQVIIHGHFTGKVDVRVNQKVMGENVEVVVCEIGKGEFFGERSLLNNEPRAATVVTKTATELVSICRDDYNVMLKQDQQAFLQKNAANIGQRMSQIIMSNKDLYVKILRKKSSARSKADLVSLASYLQTLKFFRALPKTFVQELCTIIEMINVDANTTIFREGEIGRLFYVVMSGSVDVKINAVDKKGGPMQTKLVNLGEGSHFGDLALIKKDGLRSATVVSTEASELLIIAEKDYNSILKKLQKEDMQKRLQLLDRFPTFQAVEWTSELMEEMSYILVEQRHPAGTTIFKQGDKANHIFFLIRGEIIISRVVADPKSQREHAVVVERLGPFNVFGDDAATGRHFNDPVLRNETATANTPIEALILTKYDVFNRLSRSARETLRMHTRRHQQPVVVFDQLYKTMKWEEYKRKLIGREINLDRLNKVLPHGARLVQPAAVAKPDALVLEVRPKIDIWTRGADLSLQRGAKHASLIEGNDLLLLSPIKSHATRPAAMTLADYTLNYNPDITTQKRDELLEHVMSNHGATALKTLDEGNPLVYLDYLAPTNTNATSASMLSTFDDFMHPADAISENFIFSLPSPRKSPTKLPTKPKIAPKLKATVRRGSSRRVSGGFTTLPSASRAKTSNQDIPRIEHGFAVVNLASQELAPISPHPAFRVVGQFPTRDEAAAAARHIETYENNHAYRSYAFKPDHPVEFYVVETARHVLVPPSTACLHSEYYCNQKLHEYLHDHGNLAKLNVQPPHSGALFPCLRSTCMVGLAKGVAPKPSTPNTHVDLIATIMHDICGHAESMHFCHESTTPVDLNHTQHPKKNALHLQDIEHNHMSVDVKQTNNFAVVSTLLIGDGSEPSFCVFGCFHTEIDATEYAEKAFPKELSDQALLCVVPMYEWIYFEDASDWCLQMRKSQDRHHLAMHKKELHAITQQQPAATQAKPQEIPLWLQEQQQGQRLNQLICTHMGVKAAADKESEKELDEAYTQRAAHSLEQKLESLQEILSSRHQQVAYGSSLQKMQKVQRFGHIMKMRLQKPE